MKTAILIFAVCMIFDFATAQIEPKTSQGATPDTIITTSKRGDRTNIANKDILKRNTIESGIGKPDNIKRKIPTAAPGTTITNDTIGKKRRQ
jgi:hypothetical protein